MASFYIARQVVKFVCRFIFCMPYPMVYNNIEITKIGRNNPFFFTVIYIKGDACEMQSQWTYNIQPNAFTF